MQQRCETSSCWCCTFPVLIFQRHLNQGHTTVNAVNGGQNRRTYAHARRSRKPWGVPKYRFSDKIFFFLPIFIIQHPNLKMAYLLISSATSTLPMYKCAIMAAPFAPAEKLAYIKKRKENKKWKENARNVNITKRCPLKQKHKGASDLLVLFTTRKTFFCWKDDASTPRHLLFFFFAVLSWDSLFGRHFQTYPHHFKIEAISAHLESQHNTWILFPTFDRTIG